MVRRIANTRDDVGIARHVRSSASFAARVLAALDENAVPRAFETLAGHVRTLAAFADALDVRSALQLALASSPSVDGDALLVDAALLGAADDAFAWRRLASLAGVAFEAVDLGPVRSPAIDLHAVAGRESAAAVRARRVRRGRARVVAAPQSGVRPDDARTLLATAGERAALLDVIARGAVADAVRFAHGLELGARGVQGAGRERGRRARRRVRVVSRRTATTAAVLERVAIDFDRARAFADAWEAARSHRRARRRARRCAAPVDADRRRRSGAGSERRGAHAGRRAQVLVQRVGAERVRRVRAQVVVPVRVRGGRGSRLVSVVLRHRVSCRARRLSRRPRALRCGRTRRARGVPRPLRRRSVRPAPYALRRAGRVRAAEAPRAPHREAVPHVAARARATLAVRGDRLRDRDRRRARRPPLRRLHRPSRPRRPHRHRDGRRLQDRRDRAVGRRVPRRRARVSRVSAAVLLLGAHDGGRRRHAARARAAQGRAARSRAGRARGRGARASRCRARTASARSASTSSSARGRT